MGRNPVRPSVGWASKSGIREIAGARARLIRVKAGRHAGGQAANLDLEDAMSPPARPDGDDPPPPQKTPMPMSVWALLGYGLILAYVAVLACLRPSY